MSTNFKEILEGLPDEELTSAYNKIYEEAAVNNLYQEARINELTDNTSEMTKRLSKIPLIGGIVDDINTLAAMLKDHKKYDFKISKMTIATITGALAYLVMPADLIPDTIPYIGFVDDYKVLTATIAALQKDILNYKAWVRNYREQELMSELFNEVNNRFSDNVVEFENEYEEESV